jgi:hypothetical protein
LTPTASFGIRLGMVGLALAVNAYLWSVEPREAVNQVIYPVAPPLVHIEGMGEQTLAQPGQVENQPGLDPPGGAVLFALRPAVQSLPDTTQRALLARVGVVEKRQRRLLLEAHGVRLRVQDLAVELGTVLGEQRLLAIISGKPDAVDQVGEATIWRELEQALKDGMRSPW